MIELFATIVQNPILAPPSYQLLSSKQKNHDAKSHILDPLLIIGDNVSDAIAIKVTLQTVASNTGTF